MPERNVEKAGRTSLAWKRRRAEDASLGYYADGAEFRYVVYRYNSKWLLQVRRLTWVAGVPTSSGIPVDTDTNDTLELCKLVALAYEQEAPQQPGKPNRLTRAVGAAYDALSARAVSSLSPAVPEGDDHA